MRRLFTRLLTLPLLLTGFVLAGIQISPAEALAGVGPLVTDLTYLVEEEKLARDVYRALYARWRLPIFNNISRSEQRHMDQLSALLDRNGAQAQDPTRNAAAGVFTNAKLAGLYRDLVTRGSASESAALRVGATIEDLDIQDIQTMEKRTTDRDALAVFARLKCGSRNHLRAFARQLGARGATYSAQHLSSAEFRTILGSPRERCGRQGNRGQGWRGGKGGRGQGGGEGRGQGWRGGRGDR